MAKSSAARPASPFLIWPDFWAKPPFDWRTMLDPLDASQWLSVQELQRGTQLQRRLLLEWAVGNVPFYRDTPGYASALARLRRDPADEAAWQSLPVLTKESVRAAGPRLNARTVPAGHTPLVPTHSSGSTGVRVTVQTTELSRAIGLALTLREHRWHQRDFSKRLGVTRVLPDGDRVPGGRDHSGWGPPVGQISVTGPASAIHVGRPADEIAAWLRRFDPHYLLSYPSVVAELLELLPTPPPALEEIRMMAEPLDAELEQRIINQWGVRCTDLYSAGEVGYIAMRCREHGQLHVQSESVMLEILDEQGVPCAPGQTGRVVLTRLHNLATPLLRCDMGDLATLGEPCPCGRGLPVLSRVLGRVRNLATLPDGRRVWPAGMNRLSQIEAIRQSQAVQTAPNRVELHLVLARPLTPDEAQSAQDIVRHGLGSADIGVQILTVDQIERGPSGKFEQFRSLISPAPHFEAVP